MLATIAFLGVGVVSAQMIIPDGGAAMIASTPTPTPEATPKAKKSSKPKAKKPKPLTRKEKAARADAVDQVRSQGGTTLEPEAYNPRARLRVLIGRPVGDAAGGYTAYFFTRDGFIGKDTQTPSSRLRVAKAGTSTVTLSYGIYRPGDVAGEPSGRKRVRWKLDGTSLTALDTVPAQNERFQRRNR